LKTSNSKGVIWEAEGKIYFYIIIRIWIGSNSIL